MLDLYVVNRETVKQVAWEGDPVAYDLSLFELGKTHNEFVVPNPNVAIDLSSVIKKVPTTNRCVVWRYQGQWIAKRFNNKWRIEYGYYDITLPDDFFKFNFLWVRNRDLDSRIKYEYDPFRNYQPTLDDAYYELVWYMDPRFVPEGDKVWAVKCKNQSQSCLGTKDMGYLTPQVKIEFNPEYKDLNIDLVSLYPPYYHLDHNFIHGLEESFIPEGDLYPKQWVVKFTSTFDQTLETVYLYDVSPQLEITYNDDLPRMEYDLDYTVPYWDLHYDHVWLLDTKHCETAPEDIWALKINFRKNPVGEKVLGEISPILQIEYNPDLPDLSYDINYTIPYHDLGYEHLWMLDKKHCETAPEDIWAVKITATNELIGTKIMGEISPRLKFKYNPELPKMDYDIDYAIPYHDLGYEHVWMVDKKHCETAPEDIWAVKVIACKKSNGTKIIGEVSPKLHLEYNPALPKLTYDIDYVIPYHDLGYEHVWMLDKKHTANLSDDIWAFKITTVKSPEGSKIVDWVSPKYSVEINDDLKGYRFEIPDIKVQYHDLSYVHTWKLDKSFSGNFDIWAVKIKFVKNAVDEKSMGSISPIQELIFNKSLKNLKINIDYQIPYYDRFYEHVWYLDEKYAKQEKIWVAKLTAVNRPIGEKKVGSVSLDLQEKLDVIFISYHEPNAESNWQRVLEKAAWAKRVDGVEGIFNAHKEAAKIAETDMFYVVDGDAWIVDDFNFDYQPLIFDRDCAYVWTSINPINDLEYGYGGVKLFSKYQMLKKKKWDTLDMTTGIMPKLKIMNEISNITKFNKDEFSTWRSAFRECVKLLYNRNQYPDNIAHLERFVTWRTLGENRPFGEIAMQAAEHAETFFDENCNDNKMLLKINDRAWLENKYKTLYGNKRKSVRK